MAEQNRKSVQRIQAREVAKGIVDDYLDYLFCDADGESIAREGRSLLGIYSEHGSIPRGSGFCGFCTLAPKVDRIRRRHATEDQVKAADTMNKLSDNQRDALCVDRFYRGRTKVATDPFTEQRVEIFWDDRSCAMILHCEVKAFRNRVSDGYSRLEDLMGLTEQVAA